MKLFWLVGIQLNVEIVLYFAYLLPHTFAHIDMRIFEESSRSFSTFMLNELFHMSLRIMDCTNKSLSSTLVVIDMVMVLLVGDHDD